MDKLLGIDMFDHATIGMGAEQILYTRYTADFTGTLDTIKVRLHDSGQTFRVGIYSDNSDYPDTLLADSGVTSSAVGDVDVAISDVSVVQGTVYWLAFVGSSIDLLVARWPGGTGYSRLEYSPGQSVATALPSTAVYDVWGPAEWDVAIAGWGTAEEEPAPTNLSFNGSTKVVTITDVNTLDVCDLWSRWVDWLLTSDNSKYPIAMTQVGGDDIDTVAGTAIPIYIYLQNGWKIKPREANHTLAVTNGILLTSDSSDPFNNTTGAYTVRINYQQPVQAITVSTGGGTAPTADAVADEVMSRDVLTTDNFLALK